MDFLGANVAAAGLRIGASLHLFEVLEVSEAPLERADALSCSALLSDSTVEVLCQTAFPRWVLHLVGELLYLCLLYTSDAADE